jgi:hypothetical protein
VVQLAVELVVRLGELVGEPLVPVEVLRSPEVPLLAPRYGMADIRSDLSRTSINS